MKRGRGRLQRQRIQSEYVRHAGISDYDNTFDRHSVDRIISNDRPSARLVRKSDLPHSTRFAIPRAIAKAGRPD